jgi:transposase
LAKKVLLEGMTLKAAAAAFNVSPKTAVKWVRRYQAEGRTGLAYRSSRPHRSPRRTSSELEHRVAFLRRERWTGCRIANAIGKFE